MNSYVVITPVRNEATRVCKTIDSMVAQILPPKEWIIVDDGSHDGTAKILESAAKQHKWIHVIIRSDRGHRHPGAGVIEAFNEGYGAIQYDSWKFLVKLDGDLFFDPSYFEGCLKYFASEPKLGIGGGMICIDHGSGPVEESAGDPPFHVRGATKIYRRACWEYISPLMQAPGWDTIDEVKANMLGWTTRTFKDLYAIQQKTTGSADGVWRDFFKNGRANYITGYHPLFMLLKCVRRLLLRPRFIGGVALLTGYLIAYMTSTPRVTDDVIHYLRKQQIRRLFFQRSIYG